jgi:hypothetical protein
MWVAMVSPGVLAAIDANVERMLNTESSGGGGDGGGGGGDGGDGGG